MAQVQVKVPYVENYDHYDFGIGADLATGSPMGKVVVGDVSPVTQTAVKMGKAYPQGLPPASMPTLQKGTTDVYAAKGEILTNQDPLAEALRDQQPEGEGRRGFFVGMAAAERQTAPGPGKDAIRDGLPEPERQGFAIAVQFSLGRNRAAEWAEKGAAVVRADPEVAKVARANPECLLLPGFRHRDRDIRDPALGAAGNTATGPGLLAIRDATADPDTIRVSTMP
jgi:hypothetical protein